MTNKKHIEEVHAFLLEAHRKGVESAIDLSIRTGIPLVVEENGKIKKMKPKFRYVLVPVPKKSDKRKRIKKP